MTLSSPGTHPGQDLPPDVLMLQMITGYWVTKALYVAARLRIADRVAKEPQTCETLAAEAGVDKRSLYRVMRALASVGVFAEDGQGRFGLTQLAECLRSDRPRSMRSMAEMNGAESFGAFTEFMHSIETGRPAWDRAFGKPIFEYYAENPEAGRVFDEAMTGWSQSTDEAVASAYDFSRFRRLIDLGGGRGSQLGAILRAHPDLRGVLFDLPQVIDAGSPVADDAELAARTEFVGGDFFEPLPRCDAFLLKHIIHDWDDGDAARLLDGCRRALEPGGRVMLVETVIQPGNQPEWGKLMDLEMLIIGGLERTEREYADVFAAAGLKLEKVHPVPVPTPISLIEGVAR